MVLRLCVIVELFRLPVQNIVPNTSVHDIRHRTIKKHLPSDFWRTGVFFHSSGGNIGFEHISVVVYKILVCFDILVEYTQFHFEPDLYRPHTQIRIVLFLG